MQHRGRVRRDKLVLEESHKGKGTYPVTVLTRVLKMYQNRYAGQYDKGACHTSL